MPITNVVYMFNKLKQFKDLRGKAKNLQNALGEIEVEGSASFGKVVVKMDGNQSTQSVSIDDSMMESKSKLEESLKDAFNDAVKKGHRKMAEKMKGMEGFDLPGMS